MEVRAVLIENFTKYTTVRKPVGVRLNRTSHRIFGQLVLEQTQGGVEIPRRAR